MITVDQLLKVRSELNEKSSCFCLAKWTQVTIHLQNGLTHSCHHPGPHKIPLAEIENNPSALHNTQWKMKARKQMQEGERPSECGYCWNIEDSGPNNLSDRVHKSADQWSYPKMKEIKNMPWDRMVNPAYVEVSFGNQCNFKCAYCAPHISSSIMNEVQKFGPYTAQKGFDVDSLKKNGLYPYDKDEANPYVEAFWKWWPNLKKDLQIFRITGGEPLLNANTFKFLDYLKKNPMPELNLAINSNLGIPRATLDRFIQDIKYIQKNGMVKSFQLFTSVDTFGKNAEFIRFGLKYEEFMDNVEYFLSEVQEYQLAFMCTYNAFSVINFRKYLEKVTELKTKYKDQHGHTRVLLDIPYLREPRFLSLEILTRDFYEYIIEDIKYLRSNSHDSSGKEIYYEHELMKLERIYEWIADLPENEHRQGVRREFAIFYQEYITRKNINPTEFVPEYLSFVDHCTNLLQK